MSLIVADTAPLNYLILIGRESLLEALYSKLIIPTSVHQELLHPRAPAATLRWARSVPFWAQVQSASQLLNLPTLGAGEREAISLAEELGSSVLLDERKARFVAEARGVVVIGTIGILKVAANKGLVDFEEAIRELKATNARISDQLIETVRRRPKGGPESET